jgi:hypothetical protein
MTDLGKPLRRYRVIPLKEPVPDTEEPSRRAAPPEQPVGKPPEKAPA